MRQLPLDDGWRQNRPSPIPFYYAFVVWGERYVEYMARFAIASCLSPNNIPGTANRDVSKFFIATTPDDAKLLRQHPIFKMLERTLEVVFVDLLKGAGDKYSIQSGGFDQITQMARGNACVSFLGPDAIYPDGMMQFLHARVTEGWEAVVGLGPRVIMETAVPELVACGKLRDGESLQLRPREAASLILRHMHPDAARHTVGDEHFSATPYFTLWNGPDGEGALIRSFSMHPYVVDYTNVDDYRLAARQSSAIDSVFLTENLIPPDRIYVVDDSDHFVIPSLTPLDVREIQDVRNDDWLKTTRQWAFQASVTAWHRIYYTHAIKIHTGDLTPEWEALERETLEQAYRVCELSIDPADISQEALYSYLHEMTYISSRLSMRILMSKIPRIGV